MRNIYKVLPKGATLFLCSTVPADYAQSVSAQLKSKGRDDILFVDCPVSGGAKRAADGTLSIMAGGSDEAIKAGQFLLAEMADATKLYLVPGGVGAGSNMKMVHQVLAGIHILVVGEAMGFAARLGLNATEVRDAVVQSDAWSWMYENRVVRVLEEDYFPGVSALTIILKDVVCYSFVLPVDGFILTTTYRASSHHRLDSTTSLRLYLLPLNRPTYLDYRGVLGLMTTLAWSACTTQSQSPRSHRRKTPTTMQTALSW